MSGTEPLFLTEAMVAGEDPGTWNVNANNIFANIVQGIAQRQSVALTNAVVTLTDTPKAQSQARSGMYVLTSAGLTGNAGIIVPNRSKLTLLDTTGLVLNGHTCSVNANAGGGGNTPLVQGGLLYLLYTDGSNNAYVQPLQNQDYVVAAGTNAYTCTVPSLLSTTLPLGYSLNVVFTNANTGASTLTITNGTGATAAINITKNGAVALASGDIGAAMAATLIYDGTELQILPAKIPANLGLVNGGVQTANFNVAANTRYLAEGAGITATGPASANAMDTIIIAVGSTPITFSPNGLKVNGGTANIPLSPNNTYLMTYNSVQGWV